MDPHDLKMGYYYKDLEEDTCQYLGVDKKGSHLFRWIQVDKTIVGSRSGRVFPDAFGVDRVFIDRLELDTIMNAELEIDRLLED
jgi:hypothetical protein